MNEQDLAPQAQDEHASACELLTSITRDKRTAIHRMQASFNWAFVITTGVLLGAVIRGGLADGQGDVLHYIWALLFLTLFFVSVFLVRCVKDYVNQIRYVLLQKHCYSYLFGQPLVGNKLVYFETIQSQVKVYLVDWASPVTRLRVSWKVLVELGFLPLYVIVIVVMAVISHRVDFNSLVVLVPFVVGIIFSVIVILVGYLGDYFKDVRPHEAMEGKY